jgi:hypothetical protein
VIGTEKKCDKPRQEPLELIIIRYLSFRMKLSEKDATNFSNLEKGYLGEKKFDEWLQDF